MSREGAKELAAAAREGKLADVERMLAAGLTAVVNETTEFGGTAFTQACAAGQRATAARLLEAGADLNVTTAGAYTTLMICAEKGLIDIVSMLLEKGAAVERVNKDGRTALHLSAMTGGGPKAVVVDALVKAGSGLEVADVDGNTPLLLAARYGRLDACQVLTAAGASVAAVNKAGHSAMDAARQGGNPAVEDCLLDASF